MEIRRFLYLLGSFILLLIYFQSGVLFIEDPRHREVSDTSRCIQIQIQAKNVGIFCPKTKTDTLLRPGFTGCCIYGIFTLF